MSGRLHFRGHSQSRNENSPKRIHSAKPSYNLSTPSKSGLLLYDKNDFPSLSGNTDEIPNDSHLKVLKYSDTLKSTFQSPAHRHTISDRNSYHEAPTNNQGSKSASNCSSEKSERNSSRYTHAKTEQIVRRVKDVKCQNYRSSTFIKENTNPQSFLDAKEPQNSKHNDNTPFKSPKQSNSEYHNSHSKYHQGTSLTMRQNDHIPQIKAPSISSNIKQFKPAYGNQSDCEIKCELMFDKVKLNHGGEKVDVSGKAAKNKKRKSKVKRQAALQSGKITFLTPEVHSKILNQANTPAPKNMKHILSDINNEEEYPELGKAPILSFQKECQLKGENLVATSDEEKISDASVVKQQLANTGMNLSKQDRGLEKKGKSDNKPVRPKDPITVAFFDMLVRKSSKAKGKDLKDEFATTSVNSGSSKIKSKKALCHAPNLLDSSGPVVKRGKERENPKPKKPSHLKKIILLDRKMRRDHLLQIKSNTSQEENNSTGNTLGTCDNITTENYDDGNNAVLSDVFCEENASEVPITSQLEDSNNGSLDFTLSADKNINLGGRISIQTNVSPTKNENISVSEKNLNVLEINDSLLKSLTDATKCSDTCVKEKAAKSLLHTRHFREYCNHLISEDIDDAVHALLDDLARFQDRMHQKDPVKARIKRRMIYGVKEVKKHMKLKKIKCIIIATDIENVESEGGLNDILNDIKSLAVDHNIPCVFALGRKALGKVCHKPVPVSCIGVFNADGSEANFKKMIELLSQSKNDYVDMLNTIMSKLTQEEVNILVKAKQEAPETLHDIRSNILRKYFLHSQNDESKAEVYNWEFTESSDSE